MIFRQTESCDFNSLLKTAFPLRRSVTDCSRIQHIGFMVVYNVFSLFLSGFFFHYLNLLPLGVSQCSPSYSSGQVQVYPASGLLLHVPPFRQG